MGHWHGLAKLCMHSNLTLRVLESITQTLGTQLHNFSQNNCSTFNTVELWREHQAHLRREAKRVGPQAQAQHTEQASHDGAAGAADTSVPASSSTPALSSSARHPLKSTSIRAGSHRKTLNINTYKFHSYCDYAHIIHTYGTTDSYSTEPVCHY